MDAPPAPAAPGSGPVQRERRKAARVLVGGGRANDPPLTTRDCADWMGVSTEFIRGAVDDGQLEAEDVTINGRRVIRVYLEAFVAYLQKIKWRRLPRRPGTPTEPTGPTGPAEPFEPSEPPERTRS